MATSIARKFEVNVTSLDIKRGKPGDTDECPIARAIKRALKGFKLVDLSVDYGSVTFTHRKVNYSFKLRKTATNLIHAFDNSKGTKGKPFSFVATLKVVKD